jgi:hypothetical protein
LSLSKNRLNKIDPKKQNTFSEWGNEIPLEKKVYNDNSFDTYNQITNSIFYIKDEQIINKLVLLKSDNDTEPENSKEDLIANKLNFYDSSKFNLKDKSVQLNNKKIEEFILGQTNVINKKNKIYANKEDSNYFDAENHEENLNINNIDSANLNEKHFLNKPKESNKNQDEYRENKNYFINNQQKTKQNNHLSAETKQYGGLMDNHMHKTTFKANQLKNTSSRNPIRLTDEINNKINKKNKIKSRLLSNQESDDITHKFLYNLKKRIINKKLSSKTTSKSFSENKNSSILFNNCLNNLKNLRKEKKNRILFENKDSIINLSDVIVKIKDDKYSRNIKNNKDLIFEEKEFEGKIYNKIFDIKKSKNYKNSKFLFTFSDNNLNESLLNYNNEDFNTKRNIVLKKKTTMDLGNKTTKLLDFTDVTIEEKKETKKKRKVFNFENIILNDNDSLNSIEVVNCIGKDFTYSKKLNTSKSLEFNHKDDRLYIKDKEIDNDLNRKKSKKNFSHIKKMKKCYFVDLALKVILKNRLKENFYILENTNYFEK